jgi:hypothetical protein
MEPTSKQSVGGPHFQQHNLVEIKVKELETRIAKENK